MRRRRSRYFWKLYTGYVLLILLTVAIVGIMVAHTVEEDALSTIQRSLRARAAVLRAMLTAAPDTTVSSLHLLQERIRALGRETQTRLTIIGPDGTVWADSEEEPGRMDNHGSRPEVLQAGSHGVGRATRFSRTLGTDMMYVALPVGTEGTPAGYVRTSLPLLTVQARLNRVRQVVITGAAIAALIALLLGYLVARRITAPLSEMTSLARGIVRGEYHRRVRSNRQDEIGQLAEALNAMAATSQERLEATARDRNQLHAVFTGMVEGVVAIDASERILLMNRVAGELLGTDPAAAVQKPIREVTRVAGVTEQLALALEGSQSCMREIRLTTPQEGGERILEVYYAPLRAPGSPQPGALIVLHDVSELRRLEMVRRDFVANVSHELKTPITAIQVLIETMLTDTEMSQTTRSGFLNRAAAQVSRLSHLVRDLLVLSQLEAMPAGPAEGCCDLGRTAERIVAGLSPAAERKRVALHFAPPPESVNVHAAPDALEQIVSNLTDNAIKYTPERGTVTIAIATTDGKAILRVADTGIGIDPIHQERVFERFYRVDKARSREQGGTGLGLAIVKHLVRSLGGVITLKSTPGLGSTFEVRLPLVR